MGRISLVEDVKNLLESEEGIKRFQEKGILNISIQSDKFGKLEEDVLFVNAPNLTALGMIEQGLRMLKKARKQLQDTIKQNEETSHKRKKFKKTVTDAEFLEHLEMVRKSGNVEDLKTNLRKKLQKDMEKDFPGFDLLPSEIKDIINKKADILFDQIFNGKLEDSKITKKEIEEYMLTEIKKLTGNSPEDDLKGLF